MPPTHTHQKGQLYLQEMNCCTSLSNQNISLDSTFVILRGAKTDARDGRPRDLTGRILVSASFIGDEIVPGIWKNSAIVKGGRVAESEMLKTADMVGMDSVDPETLPATSSTAVDHRGGLQVRGARRYEQLGVDACHRILDATIDGLQQSGEQVGAVLVVDANPTTGEMLEAFIVKKLSFHQMPMYYLAIAPDQDSSDQFQTIRLDRLSLQVSILEKKLFNLIVCWNAHRCYMLSPCVIHKTPKPMPLIGIIVVTPY